MAYRADKSGFAKEAQEKILASYSPEEAAKCLRWIAEVTEAEELEGLEDQVAHDDFYEKMHDGMILCKLMEKLDPDSVNWEDKMFKPSKIEALNTARERERIGVFLEFAVKYGVPEAHTFPTESLHEDGALNLAQVCATLRTVGIQAQANGIGPEDYWPKKQEVNKREFTQEQLNAGQAIIGLQMGSNKFASQSGMKDFGFRKICD